MFVILKLVCQIQNLSWHLRDGCDRTKGLFSSSPKKPSNSTSSPRRNSHSVRLLRSTLSVQTNWKRLCWKRRQPSSGRRRKRDSFAEKTPSMIGCFQGLWHWGQFTGKSVVTLTHTSKWSMSRSWKQRYLVCADSKFWIRSPEVTQEPWVKFNTSRRGLVDGIRVRVGNKKRIRADCLY